MNSLSFSGALPSDAANPAVSFEQLLSTVGQDMKSGILFQNAPLMFRPGEGVSAVDISNSPAITSYEQTITTGKVNVPQFTSTMNTYSNRTTALNNFITSTRDSFYQSLRQLFPAKDRITTIDDLSDIFLSPLDKMRLASAARNAKRELERADIKIAENFKSILDKARYNFSPDLNIYKSDEVDQMGKATNTDAYPLINTVISRYTSFLEELNKFITAYEPQESRTVELDY
jgi:hypothetical protein